VTRKANPLLRGIGTSLPLERNGLRDRKGSVSVPRGRAFFPVLERGTVLFWRNNPSEAFDGDSRRVG
jgi:hypothetical protein